MVIGFCGGFQGEELFLTSLKVILQFWEETRNKKDCSHIVVALRGRFKGETGEIGTCCHYWTSPSQELNWGSGWEYG